MVQKTFIWSAIVATLGLAANVMAEESDVLTLTQKNFATEVLDKDLMLVEFFAPWCGHCRALAPEYEKAATELKAKDIPIAKVDCTENQDLCQEYEVQGYPTLKVFRKGETADYQGPRKADGIVNYMVKQSLPALSEVASAENLAAFKQSDRVVVVGYANDAASKAALEKIASSLREEYVFGIVSDEALAKSENVEKFPSLVLYKQFDEGRNDRVGAFDDQEAIEQFIKANAMPLLDDVSPQNFKSYVDAGLPLAFIFTESKEDSQKLTEVFLPFAQQYKGKISFVRIDANDFGPHARNVGLKEGHWPAFAIQHLDDASKFPLDQSTELTSENVKDFLEKYISGDMEPAISSQDIPATNDGPVKVVVAKQFNEIVLDKSKDVFLEVYAPWCGHCKNLAPTWDQLGQMAKEQTGGALVIGKMDGTENDIPKEGGFTVAGFPTLKFFKAETNEMIDYHGDRSLDDLIQFINLHSSQPISLSSTADQDATKDDADLDHDEL
ncbi:thioredoxin-like protein [Radiomyces spectabilis]|uniref:thioredoxin-like protein n=1 Tax=Radiomyces spectabilis TaxID=64574 RepID=UPI00221F47F6|nr:thioredoxin-like protein [Radiomyces spectabilis]KAI8374327.1 thioredoxin-like protein [Radiomyces spectabilis]